MPSSAIGGIEPTSVALIVANTALSIIKSGKQTYIMHFIKRYKEILFLLGVAFVVGLASHDLFSDQRHNSGMVNSGTTLTPANFSGRTTCEVPIPSVQSNKVRKKTDELPPNLQKKSPNKKTAYIK